MATIEQYITNQEHDQAQCHCFFDWFCSDRQLEKRKKALDEKLFQLLASKKIDIKTMRFFYKNVATLGRKETHDRITIRGCSTAFVIEFSTDGKGAGLYTPENDFKQPIVLGSWEQVRNYFYQP